MKNRYPHTSINALFSVSILSIAISSVTFAQDQDAESTNEDQPQQQIDQPSLTEETIIMGRFQTAAQSIAVERQELEVAADFLDAQTISRVGDSTVATALRRLPGVNLVDDKFVYVRGLGERYSSTTLNGAVVPSPDLSRNVIPLDIFPTSIVKNLAVQKGFTSDMFASFGGGNVDIRTRGVPSEPLFKVELGLGANSESSDFLRYNGSDKEWKGNDGGFRSLSGTLEDAIITYEGNLNATNIRDLDGISLAAANQINRQLVSELNRDLDIREDDSNLDRGVSVDAGNLFYLDNGMEIGFLAGLSYDRSTKSAETIERVASDPTESFSNSLKSVDNASIVGNFSFGFRLDSDNSIETTSIFIRNTDNETRLTDFHNPNRRLSSGSGFRRADYRYEQRQLRVNQIHGSHTLYDDHFERFGLDFLNFLSGISSEWYYSDSDSFTDIPSEIVADYNTSVDTTTAEVLEASLISAPSGVDNRFTDLNDFVESYGWSVELPISVSDFEMSVEGGFEGWKKSRTYEQTQLFIDTTNVPDSLLDQTIGVILSDENVLDPGNDFRISVAGDNEDSYLAAVKVQSYYGKFDVNWVDMWRVTLGLRWEEYQQVALPWSPLNFEQSQILPFSPEDVERTEAYFDEVTRVEDDVYGSLAVSFMTQDFIAADFQLRFSYSNTTVRPDLRELSPGSYIDPITDIIVFGNAQVESSLVDNIDLRAEWFFSNDDTLSISMFYKDIESPIELFESPAADDNIAAEIENGDSAEISGIEIEFMKGFEDFHENLSPFFLQGNMTYLDTELVVGDAASAPTNDIRPLGGASEFSGNLIFGFDSFDGLHSSTLSYNYFSERLFFAGRNGQADRYEQPFASLDFTYSFYPNDFFTLKFKVSNILDENIEISQERSTGDGIEDITVFERVKGQTWSLTISQAF